MPHLLAELNLARLRHPLDHRQTAEFVGALDPINALAEAADGFVWRLQDVHGQSSAYVTPRELDDPLVIVNFSIWRDVDSLKHFVFKSGHGMYLRRRRDWFDLTDEPATVCWWIDDGSTPDVDDAYRRLVALRTNGPSIEGWLLNHPYPRPD